MDTWDAWKAVLAWVDLVPNLRRSEATEAEGPSGCPGCMWVYYHFEDEEGQAVTNVKMEIAVAGDVFGRRLGEPAVFNSGASDTILVPFPSELITPYGYVERIEAPGHMVSFGRATFHLRKVPVAPARHETVVLAGPRPVLLANILRCSLVKKELLIPSTGNESDPPQVVPYILLDSAVGSPLTNDTFSWQPTEYCADSMEVRIDMALEKEGCVSAEDSTVKVFEADMTRRVFFPLPLKYDGTYNVILRTQPLSKFSAKRTCGILEKLLCFQFHQATCELTMLGD